jgi:hypothetical protein
MSESAENYPDLATWVHRAHDDLAHVQLKLPCGHYEHFTLNAADTLWLNDVSALKCWQCGKRASPGNVGLPRKSSRRNPKVNP